MVISNMGLPDPHDPDTSLASSNDIILHNNDVGIDEMDDRYEGYQQLNSQEVPANDSDTDSDDDNEDIGITTSQQETNNGSPAIENAENELLKEVWSETKSKDIEMDSEKVRAVKDAMVNFTLPASSIPDWATNIPEQEWKNHMLEKIQAKTSAQSK